MDLVDIVMVLVVPEDLAEETLQETHLHLVHLKEIPVEHNSGQCQLTQQKLEQAEELEARVRLAQQEEPEALAQMLHQQFLHLMVVELMLVAELEELILIHLHLVDLEAEETLQVERVRLILAAEQAREEPREALMQLVDLEEY